ncbi:hypothetical protein LEP1GSC039_3508 [Leptospira santarosai str. 2000027870]|nr:hypothetical protein LEP1GSC039_3508 [Leptospira santarosai str. 2000027870]
MIGLIFAGRIPQDNIGAVLIFFQELELISQSKFYDCRKNIPKFTRNSRIEIFLSESFVRK